MQEQLVEVICDTSFLIHLATKRIKNIDNLDTEIGSISFVVPEVVRKELYKLQNIPEKKQDIITTLNFIKNLKTIPIFGNFADKELLDHVKINRSIVGTMDKVLKKQIKKAGGSVISFSKDKILLESQKNLTLRLFQIETIEMILESPTFENKGIIPRKYGYKNENLSIPLKISKVPEEAKSLVLIMDDPDAMSAVGKVWVHWVLWNISPNTKEISENSIPTGSIEGKTDFGEICYGGPAPPDKEHTYIFKLYALDTKLNLEKGSTKTDVEKAMKKYILTETKLEGKYAP